MKTNTIQNLIEVKRYCNETYTDYGIQLIVKEKIDCIIYFNKRENAIFLKEDDKEYTISFYISEGFFENLSIKRLLREILLKITITASLQDKLIKDEKYELYQKHFKSVVESLSNIVETTMKEINFDSYFNFVLYDFKYNYLFFKNEFLQDENLQSIQIYDKLNKMSLNKTLYTKKEKNLNNLFIELYLVLESDDKEFSLSNERIQEIIDDNIIELIYYFNI